MNSTSSPVSWLEKNLAKNSTKSPVSWLEKNLAKIQPENSANKKSALPSNKPEVSLHKRDAGKKSAAHAVPSAKEEDVAPPKFSTQAAQKSLDKITNKIQKSFISAAEAAATINIVGSKKIFIIPTDKSLKSTHPLWQAVSQKISYVERKTLKALHQAVAFKKIKSSFEKAFRIEYARLDRDTSNVRMVHAVAPDFSKKQVGYIDQESGEHLYEKIMKYSEESAKAEIENILKTVRLDERFNSSEQKKLAFLKKRLAHLEHSEKVKLFYLTKPGKLLLKTDEAYSKDLKAKRQKIENIQKGIAFLERKISAAALQKKKLDFSVLTLSFAEMIQRIATTETSDIASNQKLTLFIPLFTFAQNLPYSPLDQKKFCKLALERAIVLAQAQVENKVIDGIGGITRWKQFVRSIDAIQIVRD